MVNRKSKILQVILGISGTVLVALFVVMAGRVIPGLAVLSAKTSKPWASFLAISCIFFFPPYFAVTGLFSLLGGKTEGEVNARDFMSSYKYTETSKKDWVKHLVACAVGVINVFLMWTLAAIITAN